MSGYIHGAYDNLISAKDKASVLSKSAFVYVGTAPVHHLESYADAVNKPVLCANFSQAKRLLGYEDDWASYTLCEAMQEHFLNRQIGPVIFINVLNPAAHKETTGGTASITPAGGKAVIASAVNIVVASVVVTGKTKGTDYTIAYDYDSQSIVISETSAGSLGTSALAITYDIVKPSDVTASDIVGSSSGEGINTGLQAVKNVYQICGMIPAYLVVPGFSSNKTVHDAMYAVSQKVNGHWDMYMLTDIPLTDNSTDVTLTSASTWKSTNGYNKANETVSFPMVSGADEKKYHLSVLRAAVLEGLLAENNGIPYQSASNKAEGNIAGLWMGNNRSAAVVDEETINNKLNANGIGSAAYVGGRWAIWGAHSAEYTQATANAMNLSETGMMMMYYIGNDFQERRSVDVDKPMTVNGLRSIVSEEQARLDALVKIGALTYGKVSYEATEESQSDLVNGDFAFSFAITTTPLMKSLTAKVYWTDEGFVTYYEAFGA